MTELPTHDFILLGLSEGDIPISGPFDEALAVLHLMVSEGITPEEAEHCVTQITHDPSLQRATLSVVAFDDTGAMSVSSVFLMPIPLIEDRDTVVSLTDIGRWEAEMRDYMNTTGENNDHA